MFLSKRKNNNYYVHYEMNGKRKSISTKSSKKSEALKFLTTMKEELKRREELYHKAWSKPLVHLAKEYGISDVALGKICKKLNKHNLLIDNYK